MTVTPAGPGGGDYVQETAFKYVGAGVGDFALVSDPPPPPEDCVSQIIPSSLTYDSLRSSLESTFMLRRSAGPSRFAARPNNPTCCFVLLSLLLLPLTPLPTLLPPSHPSLPSPLQPSRPPIPPHQLFPTTTTTTTPLSTQRFPASATRLAALAIVFLLALIITWALWPTPAVEPTPKPHVDPRDLPRDQCVQVGTGHVGTSYVGS